MIEVGLIIDKQFEL